MPKTRELPPAPDEKKYESDPSNFWICEEGYCKWCSTEGRMVELGYDGFCPKGQGYPYGMKSPFACQWCGHSVGWFGLCERCIKPGTPKSEWPLQGDGYSVMGNHWVVTSSAPRAMADARDWAEGMREIAEILDKAGKVHKRTFLSHVRQMGRERG